MEVIEPMAGRSQGEKAVVRVGAYLVCLGLPDECAELQARDLLRRAGEEGVDGANAVDSAIAAAMSRYEDCLGSVGGHETDGAYCTAVLPWCLHPVLSDNPQFFSQQGELPESIHRALERARQCPLAEPAPAAMPTQSFGPMPAFCRAGIWRGVVPPIGGNPPVPSEASRDAAT